MSSTNGNPQNDWPQAVSVEFDATKMYVHLADGRVVAVPVNSYERLREATPQQLLQYRIFGGGIGIRWDDIDEDLFVPGLIRDFGPIDVTPLGDPKHSHLL